MARGHPVDRLGRILPECSWPPERRAPGSLEAVRRFCNTTNLESGADRLADPEDFARWLVEQHYEAFAATDEELLRCRRFRESIRAAAISHRDGASDAAALTALGEFVDEVEYRIDFGAEPLDFSVAPERDPVEQFIGSLAVAIVAARATDEWERLKACGHCRWVVFDHSKNRSGRWCSVSACGGRIKVQRHRARRRAAADDG